MIQNCLIDGAPKLRIYPISVEYQSYSFCVMLLRIGMYVVSIFRVFFVVTMGVKVELPRAVLDSGIVTKALTVSPFELYPGLSGTHYYRI